MMGRQPEAAKGTIILRRILGALKRRFRRVLAQSKQQAIRATQPNRKPVIGLAGFFGPGNFGDELFLSVFEKYLGDDFELKILADLHTKPFFSRPEAELVAEVDAVLIGGGDILQPGNRDNRYFNPWWLKKPCFVAGIGVPLYGEEREWPMTSHRNFLHDPNLKRIGVRDEQSAEWIREKMQPPLPVLVAPDIVTSLDLPPVEKPEGAPILGIVTRFRPNRDEPDDYTRVAELAEHAKKQGFRIRHIILGTDEVGQRDLANAADLDVPDKEIVHSESLDDLCRAIGECTVLASMKFHGTVVATMYGVPSIVMIATNKNQNFMRRLGLGALLSNFASDQLIEKFDNRPTPDPEKIAATKAEADAHMRELADAIRKELGVKA